MSILSSSAPTVKPALPITLSDADFSIWCAEQWNMPIALPAPSGWQFIEPGPDQEPADSYAVSEAWWHGFDFGVQGIPANAPPDYSSALVAAFRLGYESGFDNYETERLSAPTIEDQAENLGFELGADGIIAELPTPNAGERSAFERGHDAGDEYLWRVDPLFAAHLQERAERAEADATIDPGQIWQPAELIECGAMHQLVRV